MGILTLKIGNYSIKSISIDFYKQITFWIKNLRKKMQSIHIVNQRLGMHHYYLQNHLDAIFRFKFLKFLLKKFPFKYQGFMEAQIDLAFSMIYFRTGKEKKCLNSLNSSIYKILHIKNSEATIQNYLYKIDFIKFLINQKKEQKYIYLIKNKTIFQGKAKTNNFILIKNIKLQNVYHQNNEFIFFNDKMNQIKEFENHQSYIRTITQNDRQNNFEINFIYGYCFTVKLYYASDLDENYILTVDEFFNNMLYLMQKINNEIPNKIPKNVQGECFDAFAFTYHLRYKNLLDRFSWEDDCGGEYEQLKDETDNEYHQKILNYQKKTDKIKPKKNKKLKKNNNKLISPQTAIEDLIKMKSYRFFLSQSQSDLWIYLINFLISYYNDNQYEHHSMNILELNCNIGIFGKIFKQFAVVNSITGVDSSNQMLKSSSLQTIVIKDEEGSFLSGQKAYTQLIQDDATCYLQYIFNIRNNLNYFDKKKAYQPIYNKFKLIISLKSIHFADLENFIKLIKNSIENNGVLVLSFYLTEKICKKEESILFSIGRLFRQISEEIKPKDPETKFDLDRDLFMFSEEYVDKTLLSNQFKILHKSKYETKIINSTIDHDKIIEGLWIVKL